jgi:DNA-binding protein HU-beta
MNKSELISVISAETKLSKAAIRRVIDATIVIISSELKKGKSVMFIGFGKFKVTRRPPRNSRNPRTGAKLKIGAVTAPVFSPGKNLKDAIN